MLASIRRLPLRQASGVAHSLTAARPSTRSLRQLHASHAASSVSTRTTSPAVRQKLALAALPHSHAAISQTFSTSSVQLERAEEATTDQDAASESADVGPTESTAVAERGSNTKPPRVKDSSFASMKGHISYPTWKALTVSPFNYKDMSLVQEKVLHLLPELAGRLGKDSEPMPDGQGRDLLVKAKTGTGKTIGFLVPAIEGRVKAAHDCQRGRFSDAWKAILARHRPDLVFEDLDKHGRIALEKQFVQNTVGALILSPTRELATQIAMEAQKLLTHHDDMQVQLLVGGASRNHQINDWRRGRPDIVVGTPGRVLDLLKDVGMMKEAMSATRALVLDEADTLLEMGFRDELKAIMDFLPPKGERQTMLFSATVSPQIRSIARASLEKDHRFIDCVPEGEDNVHKHIPQYCTVVDSAEEQLPHVLRLIAHDQLTNPGKSKVIVFAATTKLTQMISDMLKDCAGALPAGRNSALYEIHSKKDQDRRFKTSDRFRKDQTGASVLVTSDVSARGVDYPGTTRVIQVGVPPSKDQYIHRIGRTGRAGAEGRADLVLLNWEQGFLHFQLDDLPVQKLNVSELSDEVDELCQRFDESPRDFDPPALPLTDKKALRAKQLGRDRASRSHGPVRLSGPLTGKLTTEKLNEKIEDSIAGMDPETTHEAFSSMLGFYMGRTGDLRTTKSAVLQGLKQWAVKAGKMEREPFVGDAFLKKLGMASEDGFSSRRNGGNSGRGRFADRGAGGFGGDRRGGFGSRRDGAGRGDFGARGGDFGGRREGGFRSDRGGSGGFGGGSRSGGYEGRGRSSSFGGSSAPRRFDRSDKFV